MGRIARCPRRAQVRPRGLIHHLLCCRKCRPGRFCAEMLRLKGEARCLKRAAVEVMVRALGELDER